VRSSISLAVTVCVLIALSHHVFGPLARGADRNTSNPARAGQKSEKIFAEDERKTELHVNIGEGTARNEEPTQDAQTQIVRIEKTVAGEYHNRQATKDTAKAKKEAVKKSVVGVVTLRGAMPEGAGQDDLFGALEPSLFDTARRFDQAAKDEKLGAVLLRLRSPAIGRAKVAEIRAAIARARKAGKKVYAQMTSASTTDYLLAAACDEIVMPESGTLILPGVRAEVMFYKGLFDKLGIKAEMMQMGDFKGAGEPYTRTEMSPEFRKQLEMLIDGFYESMIETISADRNLDREKVVAAIDTALHSPKTAKAIGLIDTVAYEDAFRDSLKAKLKVDEVTFTKNYGRKKVDTDFSGMLGMMKLMEMMMGGGDASRRTDAKKLAVIHASGAITTGSGGASLFGGSAVGSDTMVRAFEKAAVDDSVVAIVLRIDSPGGSALASDLIWNAIQQAKTKKPVIASMGDTAASGGYYIAMSCDKIYAERDTLTGSIGVVGGKIAYGGLLEKVGLSTTVVSRGKNSGLFSMESGFTDSERAAWKANMAECYELFTSKVAAGREIDIKKLKNDLAGGRVWSGKQARENGLVDELGTFHDALKAAKRAGGVKEDDKVELMMLPKPTGIFESLFGDPNDESTTRIGDARIGRAVETVAPGSTQVLGEIETLRRLFAEPTLYMMPCRVDIK
jgi:protease-4